MECRGTWPPSFSHRSRFQFGSEFGLGLAPEFPLPTIGASGFFPLSVSPSRKSALVLGIVFRRRFKPGLRGAEVPEDGFLGFDDQKNSEADTQRNEPMTNFQGGGAKESLHEWSVDKNQLQHGQSANRNSHHVVGEQARPIVHPVLTPGGIHLDQAKGEDRAKGDDQCEVFEFIHGGAAASTRVAGFRRGCGWMG
jgi:hypothetical protein